MDVSGTAQREALNGALRSWKRFARLRAGESVWRFRPDGLQVEWVGTSLEVSGTFDGEGVIHVAESATKMLVGGPFPGAETITVRVAGDRLWIGKLSVSCSERTTVVPQLIPVDASPVHVVLVSFLHTAEEIEASGASERVAAALEKKRSAVARAAKALEWLRIPKEALETLVDEHLRAQATGQKVVAAAKETVRTLVVDRSGQVELL